ncbi:MAG TPA: MFS transporter [Gaiellaceae bacterium]|nr:MFS transporter [Gaiellaceae bacterium]
MFLLPSIALGLLLALLLGGRPSRLLEVPLHRAWSVWLALGGQVVLFAFMADRVPPDLMEPLHLATYGLLFVFAAANIRVLALAPLLAGMALNALAILANGGRMPVAPGAWEAAGLSGAGTTNVQLGGERLQFLGDVFALPSAFPLTNVFSIGDILIGVGAAAFIVTVATGDGRRTFEGRRLVQPFKSPSYRRLAAGKLVSHLGDWLTLAALVGWIYGETSSVGHVAVLLLVRLAPPILGGGLAAALVDRLPKERLLLHVELIRGAVVCAALLGVLADERALAFAAMAVSGALAALSSATVPALVPSLLDEDELPAANAGLGVAQDGAMAAGALTAGVLLSWFGAGLALTVDLLTFVVAAALYSGIRTRPPARAEDEDARSEPGIGIRAGAAYVLRRPTLAVVIGAFGIATLATGLTNATLPRFLGALGLGDGAYGYGLAALALGLAAGQALVGFASVGDGGVRWIGAGLMAMASLFVCLALTEHAPTAVLLLALIGLADGTTDVLFDTIVQRETDPRYYGRVFGFSAAFMTTTMMGAVAVAPLVNRLGPPREVVLGAGVTLLGGSAFAFLGARRGRRVETGDVERPQAADPLTHPSGVEPSEPERLAPIFTLAPPEREESKLEAVRVVVRLQGGGSVVVGSFPTREIAVAKARELVAYLTSLEPSEWPLVGDHFLRPESISSLELVRVTVTEWLAEPDSEGEHGARGAHATGPA